MQLDQIQKNGEAGIDKINSKIDNYSEVTKSERDFLYGLVRKVKPKKICEIGVSSGASSAIILDAIKDIESSHLYSVDLSRKYYRDVRNNLPQEEVRSVGFLVDEMFPELKTKWSLYTGNAIAFFIDEIGKDRDIDFVFLDAAHGLPGEILDFLVVLPYVAPSCIFVIHDINIQLVITTKSTAPRILMNSVSADKFYPVKTEYQNALPNIGAFRINGNTSKNILDVFHSLLIDWVVPMDENTANRTSDCLSENYGSEMARIFQIAFEHNRKPDSKVVKIHKKRTFLQKCFSITNEGKHKIVRFLGLKLKIRQSK